MPLENDGEYSPEGVEERNDKELVDNFSNFCYRTLLMAHKTLGGKIIKVGYNYIEKENRNSIDINNILSSSSANNSRYYIFIG